MSKIKLWWQLAVLAGTAALAVAEFTRHSRKLAAERRNVKTQIHTWEDEGGALPELPSPAPSGPASGPRALM